jgi:thiol-disulfide isomerase/thioredoxin
VRWTWIVFALLALASVALAQNPAPPTAPPAPAPAVPPAPAAPPAPPSPVSGIRNKLAAGDLLSAESILEVHRQKSGEDSTYLVGLSWLARGALLVGDTGKAERYAADVRARCADRFENGAKLETDHSAEIALGAAIEVEAQLIERSRGAKSAAEMLRAELAKSTGPPAFRSRLNKRLNMLTMDGMIAPELEIEDWLGAKPPTLAAFRGRPVVLFLWAEWCGDCKAQAEAVAAMKTRHVGDGVQVVALTRYYDDPPKRASEKARVDSVWRTVYSAVGNVPVVFSTKSMERYGGSSTPTFVFVDRKGFVRGYTPTRLTGAEMERAVAEIVK